MPCDATKHRRRAAGLCVACGAPNDREAQVCDDCRRRNTDYQRKRRRRLQAERDPSTMQRCSLCREPGHQYATCRLNPTSEVE